MDPIYGQPVGEILALVEDNLRHAPDWLDAHSDSIDWSYLGSVDAHVRASHVAADLFATDYVAAPQHYVPALLPQLPFDDGHFALTLSAHLLFVNARLSLSGHLDALRELVRVTHGEVRVHPVVEPTRALYPHLDQNRQSLAAHGISTELRPGREGLDPRREPHPHLPSTSLICVSASSGTRGRRPEIDRQLDAPNLLDAVVDELRRGSGATLANQPVDMSWGQRFAIVSDPGGYRIAIKAPLAATE